jgi:hypothetical protein
MGGSWSGPAVRPAYVDFGADWIFLGGKKGSRPIHWTHWTRRSAYGAGQYLLSDGCCTQILDYPANIALTDVQYHGSTPYFRDATITARGYHAVRLWYGTENTPSGPITGWHYPDQYEGLPPGAWFASSTVACWVPTPGSRGYNTSYTQPNGPPLWVVDYDDPTSSPCNL